MGFFTIDPVDQTYLETHRQIHFLKEQLATGTELAPIDRFRIEAWDKAQAQEDDLRRGLAQLIAEEHAKAPGLTAAFRRLIDPDYVRPDPNSGAIRRRAREAVLNHYQSAMRKFNPATYKPVKNAPVILPY